MIWATVSSWSCFCWLWRASPSFAAKNKISLISVLTIWWCPCVESSLVLLEEGVYYDQCILLAKFTWGQTMVEVMKIMVTSFKRSHACPATLTAPNPEAGHHWPTPPLETLGHSQTSLGQSLVGSLLLSPGSWCTQGSVCALQVSVSQSCISSGSSVVGLMAISSKRAYAIPKSAAARAPVPVAVHCWPIPPQETLKHSSVSVSVVSTISLSLSYLPEFAQIHVHWVGDAI